VYASKMLLAAITASLGGQSAPRLQRPPLMTPRTGLALSGSRRQTCVPRARACQHETTVLAIFPIIRTSARHCSDRERSMTHVSSKEIGVVSVSPTTNGATVRSGLHRAARVIADAFTSAVLDSTTSAIASARSAVFDWATIGLDQGQRTASVDAHPTTTRQPATASGINPKRLSRNPKASILDENSPAKSGELRGSARRRRTHKSVHRLRPQWPGGRAAVSPAQMLAVWSYERPRLRRAFKVCYALWFAALWATAAAPTAAAWPDPQLPDGEFSDTAGGLRDIYGVPISAYRVSTVGPLEAASIAAGHQLHGLSLFNPESWVRRSSRLAQWGQRTSWCQASLMLSAPS
jgi:hypothetical protein